MPMRLTSQAGRVPGGRRPPRPPSVTAAEALDKAVRLNRLLALIGETRARELEELRADFNRPYGWGVLLLPTGWIAVRGRSTTIRANSALHLRELLSTSDFEAVAA